jgi:hypothetical protein
MGSGLLIQDGCVSGYGGNHSRNSLVCCIGAPPFPRIERIDTSSAASSASWVSILQTKPLGQHSRQGCSDFVPELIRQSVRKLVCAHASRNPVD